MNEARHTFEWVMSHIWMSHVTHMKEACHTYEWGMSHRVMSHESCVMSRSITLSRHVTQLSLSHSLVKSCIMSHIQIIPATHMNEKCRSLYCSVLQCVAVWCSVLRCIAVCRSVLQCAAVYCSVLQCAAVCCSVLQCAAVSCSVLQWMSHVTQTNKSCYTYEWVMSHIWMCHVTHMNTL